MIEPRSFLLDALRLFAHLDFGVVAAIGSNWEVLVEGTNLTKKSAVHGRDPPQSRVRLWTKAFDALYRAIEESDTIPDIERTLMMTYPALQCAAHVRLARS